MDLRLRIKKIHVLWIKTTIALGDAVMLSCDTSFLNGLMADEAPCRSRKQYIIHVFRFTILPSFTNDFVFTANTYHLNHNTIITAFIIVLQVTT